MAVTPAGPPARTRKRRMCSAWSRVGIRSTRAHAEETRSSRTSRTRNAVHPRARGRDASIAPSRPRMIGPPARTRKRHIATDRNRTLDRSTRAHAEETRIPRPAWRRSTVHPRARGRDSCPQALNCRRFLAPATSHRVSQPPRPYAGCSLIIPWPNALCRPTPSSSVCSKRSASVTVSDPSIQACGTTR